MATLSDVASRAGVSVSAVSRVLTGASDARVSDATRERIRRAAAELDYRPNHAARALKKQRTDVVGLIVPDLTNALFTELMSGAEEEAERQGYVVLLARAEGVSASGGPSGAIARLIGEGRVDAAIVQIGDETGRADLQRLISSGLPIVFANSVAPAGSGSVILDDQAGVGVATAHLVELGHTRIGFLGGLPASDSGQRRESGFRAAMASAGLEVDEGALTRLGFTVADGAAALEELLTREAERPTAVVVANVNAALGVLKAARAAGLDVPRELSVVAIHDASTAEHAWPPLTTVRMPLRELGRTAMRDAIERLATGVARDAVVRDPPPELVVRSSTAALAR
jgi:LacI family transcriptional regulator